MTLPAATIAEGPLAQDQATFTWNGFVFGNVDTFPRAYLPLDGGVTGLRDRADSEDIRTPMTGADGEFVYPSRLRGKPVIFTGRLQAADPVSLAQHRTAFVAAMTPTPSGVLDLVPFTERGGVEWFARARVQAAVCDPSLTRNANARPTPYQHDFVVSFRLHIPTFFALPLHSATGTDDVSITNAGNAPSLPIVTVTLATGIHDVTVGNFTTGKALVFDDVDAGAGGDLVVDLDERTATIGSDDAWPYLNEVTSDWLDELGDDERGVISGVNVISQTGGTAITVNWWDTSY